MNSQKVRQHGFKDQRLRYALRMTGFAVVLLSTFFLMRSITLDPIVNGFFAVSAGLGFVILVAGWIPTRKPVHQPAAVLRNGSRFDQPMRVPVPAWQPTVKRVQ